MSNRISSSMEEILEEIIRVIHRWGKLAVNSPLSFHLFTKHEKGFIRKDPVSTGWKKEKEERRSKLPASVRLSVFAGAVFTQLFYFSFRLSRPPRLTGTRKFLPPCAKWFFSNFLISQIRRGWKCTNVSKLVGFTWNREANYSLGIRTTQIFVGKHFAEIRESNPPE